MTVALDPDISSILVTLRRDGAGGTMTEERWTPPEPRRAEPRLPGTRRGWVRALGQVSGLLLALRAEEADGATPPDPLADGLALRAWSSLTGPVLRDPARLTVPEVDIIDLALVGAAARVLGTSLCRWRAGGPADAVTAVLRREAAVHDCSPEHLVAQVARVHGVLAAADGPSGALVWWALDDGGPSAWSWDVAPVGP
jgi:hypothetical protein